MAEKKNESPETGKIASVKKAIRILNCFSGERREQSLKQIAAITGYPKTTVFGILATLESENLIARSPNSQNYMLGTGLMELAYHAKASLSIVQIAAPVMDKLAAQAQQNVYLTTHSLGRLLFLDSCYRAREHVGYSTAGKVLPMHCTATGKAMLAYMTPAQVERIIAAHPLKAVTSNTITDMARLKEELALIRQRGYAIDNEEETIGVKCVAAPVIGAGGIPVGALSLSGAAVAMTDERIRQYYEMLAEQTPLLGLNAHLFPYRFLPDTEEVVP